MHYVFERGFYTNLDSTYKEDYKAKQLDLLRWITEDIDTICDRYSYSRQSKEVELLSKLLYFFARMVITNNKKELEWLSVIDE